MLSKEERRRHGGESERNLANETGLYVGKEKKKRWGEEQEGGRVERRREKRKKEGEKRILEGISIQYRAEEKFKKRWERQKREKRRKNVEEKRMSDNL